MEEVEELLTLHSFVKSATKGGINMSQQQAFIEQECIISMHSIKGGIDQTMGNYFLSDKLNNHHNYSNSNSGGANGGRNGKKNKNAKNGKGLNIQNII